MSQMKKGILTCYWKGLRVLSVEIKSYHINLASDYSLDPSFNGNTQQKSNHVCRTMKCKVKMFICMFLISHKL